MPVGFDKLLSVFVAFTGTQIAGVHFCNHDCHLLEAETTHPAISNMNERWIVHDGQESLIKVT